MAVLNFPINPGGQTPVNTYSPTSTPDNTASSNGGTYIWNGIVWTAATFGSYLSLEADAGAQTVQSPDLTLFVGKVASAATVDSDPSNTLTTKGYISSQTQEIESNYLPLSGGTMSPLAGQGIIVFSPNQPIGNGNTPGLLTISDSINSTSSTTAASSYAVKLAYDHATDSNNLAAAALPLTGGSMLSGQGGLNGVITFAPTQPVASTSVPGITLLSNSVSSTSTTTAGTSNAVKLAYDKASQALAEADAALPLTGSTASGLIMTGPILFNNFSSPSIALNLNGTATFVGTVTSSGNFNSTSDVRVKENIKPLENSLSKVNQLRGVEYDRTDTKCHQIGVIAQEIEKVYPDFVSTDSEGMKSVSYGQMVSVLIEAVKELSQEVDKLKEVINN